MKAVTAPLLLACLALAAAQLTVTPSPQAASGTGPLDMAGSLPGSSPSAGSFPAGAGPLAMALNPAATSAANPANPANPNANNADPMSQIFGNPLMNYGLMGGDNPTRAFMLPFLSRLGGSNTANYYYLHGGMDKYAKVMMSDMISSMLARSTGINPLMSSLFASQITDAPDNYVLSNLLFNRRNMFGGANNNNNNGGSGGSGMNNAQSQGLGMLPAGAASPFQQGASGMFSGLNPATLATMAMV